VSSLRFGFSVDREHLNETGADPEDVSLYRRSESEPDGWERLETERVDPAVLDLLDLSEDRVHLTATTDDFSVFAVATERPVVRPTAVSLASEAVEPGGSVGVRATLANEGGSDGTHEATLTADGEPVATTSASLAPDETTTVAFETAFDEPGAYDLAVDGVDAGTVVVGDPFDDADDGAVADAGGEGAADGDDSAASGSTGPTEEPSGIGLASLGGLFALVLIAVAGIALVRRMPR